MDNCISFVVENKINVIVDGTMSNYEKSEKNVIKFHKSGYRIGVVYVYQEPAVAWTFTQAREKTEGRRIRRTDFIDAFFAAYQTVKTLQQKHGDKFELIGVKKNHVNKIEDFQIGISDITSYISISETVSSLEEKLDEEQF